MLVLTAVDQVVPLKLYGLVCSPAPVSEALIIIKYQLEHSGHDLLLNVKLGPCLSILISGEVLVGSTFQTRSTLR